MGQAVDTESSLLDEEDSENTAVDEATEEVAPAETADEHREDQGHENDRLDVVTVLPDDDGILVEVGDISAADAAGVLLHDHPADVAVKEALADGIGILLGVGIAMVRTMETGPPASAALNSSGATGGEEDPERKGSLIAGVSPETMVTSSDAKTSEEVVENSEDGGLGVERNPVRRNQTGKRNEDDEGRIEPVHVLVPVLGRDGLVGDICSAAWSEMAIWRADIDALEEPTRLLDVPALLADGHIVGSSVGEGLSGLHHGVRVITRRRHGDGYVGITVIRLQVEWRLIVDGPMPHTRGVDGCQKERVLEGGR